jgi:hypothetical protein
MAAEHAPPLGSSARAERELGLASGFFPREILASDLRLVRSAFPSVFLIFRAMPNG